MCLRQANPLPNAPRISLPKPHVRFEMETVPPPSPRVHAEPAVDGPSVPIIDDSHASDDTPVDENGPENFQTLPNVYGLYRIYPSGRPSFVPDTMGSIDDVADSPNFRRGRTIPVWSSGWSKKAPEVKRAELDKLFPNKSVYLLMDWYFNGSSGGKSLQQLNSLVNDVLIQPDFDPKSLKGFRAEKEMQRIDDLHNSPSSYIRYQDPWIRASPSIPLCPPTYAKFTADDLPTHSVDGMYHRELLALIQTALSEPAAEQFHLFPYEEYWKSPSGTTMRVHLEMYTSPMFVAEHLKVQEQARSKGIELETVIIGLCFWSDSTHLTQFGSASLWPVYVSFANQSKYSRGKPSTFSTHHLAYIPKVFRLRHSSHKAVLIWPSLTTCSKVSTKMHSVNCHPSQQLRRLDASSFMLFI